MTNPSYLRTLFTLSSVVAFAAGQSIVWEALTKDNNGVRVYANDTYEIVVNSVPWLQSIPSQLHVNYTWYTASSNSSDDSTCSYLQDTDCRGSDLYNFTTQDPHECCTNCSNTPSCGAWTYTGTTGISTASLPPWAYHCYIKSDCSGRSSYGGHLSGTKTLPTAALLRIGDTLFNGTDPTLGSFEGYQIQYVTNQTNISFFIAFKYYSSINFFTFEQSFPVGVDMLNISTTVNSTSGSCVSANPPSSSFTTTTTNEPSPPSVSPPLTEFCSSRQASSIFPGFSAADTAPSSNQSGYVTWAGRFCYVQTGAGIGNGISYAGGSEGGPMVFYGLNTDSNPSRIRPTDAFVLGPVDNFKSNILGGPGPAYPGQGGGFGIQGYVTSLPANFVTTTGLIFSTTGVTDAMHAYGNILLTKYNTTRMWDPFISNLGYYTDNGAYYDWYSYSNITSKGVPEDVLIELSQTFRNASYGVVLPVTYYQLDAYWYPYERSDGNCKVNDTVYSVAFPHGLPYLREQLDAPFLIYNGPTCGDTSLANTWPMIYSNFWNQGWGNGIFAQIHPDSSYAYYSQLFRNGKTTLGMGGFEIDFMDMNYLLFPDFTTNVHGSEGWLGGMAQAAFDNGFTIQYCMQLPSDMLLSVLYSSVTNARASQDYGAGGSNYLIGGSSLLLSSVGIAASKDNFWTSQNEINPYLVAAVTALSCGPVGFADEVGYTNPDVVMRTTTANGTLLHPSRPATTIDRLLMANPSAPLAGNDVRIASTNISGTLYYTILASGSSNLAPLPSLLVTEDFWPSTNGRSYVVWGWNSTSSICQNGMNANECVFPLVSANDKTSVEDRIYPPQGLGVTPFWIYQATPVSSNGYVLLGEDEKYVPISPYRFSSIVYGSNGITVQLSGAPLEKVSVVYVKPNGTNGTVVISTVTLNSDGSIVTVLN